MAHDTLTQILELKAQLSKMKDQLPKPKVEPKAKPKAKPKAS